MTVGIAFRHRRESGRRKAGMAFRHRRESGRRKAGIAFRHRRESGRRKSASPFGIEERSADGSHTFFDRRQEMGFSAGGIAEQQN